ncbi:uncharacterized protein LOC132941671 [Metopolophium dirhodum]|uniref:uncharacterized protein LOC132941671 n=1 Tax=Metopolophium dirhodum TaxID=44670 RepID=UPI00298FF036|nr:uncharacterized protein LOC132941671 [Metopolophium dirhodum]
MSYAVPSVSQAMTNRNDKYVMNSPIGKILIEETSPSIMSSMPPKQPFIEYINLPSPAVSRRSNPTPLTRPIKRVLFPTVESKGSNRSSKYNTEYDCGMTDIAFKNVVVSSLTKVKHEISAIHSTVNSSYMVLEGFINNFGQSRATEIAMQYENGCSLDDFFPITNEEDLQLLNNIIKSDKQFRLNMVSKLSLLVGTKDVGDSVRRLMGRMFIDDVLTEYSLLGKKKKINFSELPVYQLFIDALRIHQKYKDKINKDFNDPFANWLNHSKFRLLNKAVEKNNKL